jgi:hypothetical protein
MGASSILKPKMVRLGNIKIGGLGEERTAQNGNKYRLPRKHPFFTVTGTDRNPDDMLIQNAELMEELLKAGYGTKIEQHEAKVCGMKFLPGVRPEGPHEGSIYQDSEYLTRLPVVVYSNNPDEILRVSWMWYHGERLAGSSDGVTLTLWYDRHADTWYNEPRKMPWDMKYAEVRDARNSKLFKMHSILNVAIRHRFAVFGGVYQFRTTSQISSEQLYGSILCLGEVIRGMPLQLVLKPITVRPGGKETVVYCVHLEMDGRELEAMKEQVEANRKALEEQTQQFRAMIAAHPADRFDDDVEEAEVGREFHPDQTTIPKI